MTAITVNPGYAVFFDGAGDPLDAGYVYIGLENQDAITATREVYWDPGFTCIKCGAMGVLPWRYTDERAGPVTWCLKCIRPSRCCSFTPVVRTTALQVTLVLSGPRAIARHQQLELFVLIGRVGMPGECGEDQKGSKSPRSLMTVDSTPRRFYRHLQILVPCCPHMPEG